MVDTGNGKKAKTCIGALHLRRPGASTSRPALLHPHNIPFPFGKSMVFCPIIAGSQPPFVELTACGIESQHDEETTPAWSRRARHPHPQLQLMAPLLKEPIFVWFSI